MGDAKFSVSLSAHTLPDRQLVQLDGRGRTVFPGHVRRIKGDLAFWRCEWCEAHGYGSNDYAAAQRLGGHVLDEHRTTSA